MKLIEEKGNLLDKFQNKYDVICHQVNCFGVMGGGIALQIKKRFPNVYMAYNKLCTAYMDNKQSNKKLLGHCQLVPVNSNYAVANLFGQYDYGIDTRKTDYNAVRNALVSLRNQIESKNTECSIGFPYKFGCGLAGGNWDVVKQIIIDVFEDSNFIIGIVEF